ncbi:MAG: ATP synthase F1 subunit epsilon [Egibacteraceae bacterium]
MATMEVQVLSPERVLFSGEANEVYARSMDGQIGILPGHEPALLQLDVAPVKVKSDGEEHVFAVYSGFLELRDDRLVVLAESAEEPDQIDRSAAESLRSDAQERLRSDPDDERAAHDLKRATLALDLAS